VDATILLPAVFSLIGVALGTAGSIIVGYFSTRAAREQAKIQRETTLRAERKEVILEHLRVIQECQHYLVLCIPDYARAPEGWDRQREWNRLDNQLWLSYKKFMLVAGRSLRARGVEFTDAVDNALKGRVPDGVTFWDYLDPFEERFLEAARTELGVAPS